MLYEKTNKLNLNENFFRQIMVEYDDGCGGDKLNLFLHFFVVVVEHIRGDWKKKSTVTS